MDGGAERKSKKAKASPTVFTFGASHAATKVQLLSHHTLHHLCAMFCKHTTIGDGGEGVHDHMWNIVWQGRCYESGDVECVSELRARAARLRDLALAVGAKLRLKYDYGSTSVYDITLVETSTLADGENPADFPRKLEAAAPPGYRKYAPPADLGVDLDATFARLNAWAFVEGTGVALNLFQPPRKHNHGYIERGNMGVSHMVLMPAAPPKDLAAYLHCLDEGVGRGSPRMHGSCPEYSWYSMVVLPAGSADEKARKKWGRTTEVGFCEVEVVRERASLAALNAAFPKLAALAGFAKDKKVPKGWLTLKDGALRICRGKSKSPASNAPKGTAFLGSEQHEPEDETCVLFTMDADAASLHDLFCVAEGLLRCL